MITHHAYSTADGTLSEDHGAYKVDPALIVGLQTGPKTEFFNVVHGSTALSGKPPFAITKTGEDLKVIGITIAADGSISTSEPILEGTVIVAVAVALDKDAIPAQKHGLIIETVPGEDPNGS